MASALTVEAIHVPGTEVIDEGPVAGLHLSFPLWNCLWKGRDQHKLSPRFLTYELFEGRLPFTRHEEGRKHFCCID